MEQPIHTRSTIRDALGELHETLLEFGSFVSGMLARAMRALTEQDARLAAEVTRSDDVADDLDRRVEDIGLRLLSLLHPMARDLYAVTGSIRIAADLERIADYSNDIAKVARRLAEDPLHWELIDLGRMASQAQVMLRLALEAVVAHDLENARQVARMDSEVDQLWKTIRNQCMDHMRVSPEYVEQATFLLLCARYLERIGDHIVNIAERVHFMETGRVEKLR
jgi:phosphate transport system protein